MKAPFCRQGNKYPLRNEILHLIPEHKTFVELFTGSGAIFFLKQKAEINILNDLDTNTIRGLKLVKNAPLSKIKPQYPKLDTVERITKFYIANQKTKDPIEKILIEKIRTCSGFSGKPVTNNKIYKHSSPTLVLDALPFYKEKLKGVELTNEDYETIIREYDSKKTFFFVDPPYENSSEAFGYAENKDFDFDRLKKALTKMKGDFLMTINDSPRIRKLFKPFFMLPVEIPNVWTHDVRKELIITNYRI